MKLKNSKKDIKAQSNVSVTVFNMKEKILKNKDNILHIQSFQNSSLKIGNNKKTGQFLHIREL